MIYTVTFNPSIDYIIHINSIKMENINRSEYEEFYPGGKGINVSIVLKNLGFESKILGFIAGFSGMEIENMLNKYGCDNEFIRVSGYSRINVKIRGDEKEFDINGQGPHIDAEDIEKLFYILKSVNEGDFIVLAGSIPNTLPRDIYENILKRLAGKSIKAVVDATGETLLNTLKYNPFLIKPNHIELGEIFGRNIYEKDEVVFYAKKLRDMGAENVIVSLAERGAVLVDENEKVYILEAPKGKLINSVGAGDSMVAGFIACYIETSDYEKAFKMAVAAGSASAFKSWLAQRKDIEDIWNHFIGNTIPIK